MTEPQEYIITEEQLELIEMYSKWSDRHKKAVKEIRSRPLPADVLEELELWAKGCRDENERRGKEIPGNEIEIAGNAGAVIAFEGMLQKIVSIRSKQQGGGK